MSTTDKFASGFIDFILKWRWAVMLLSLLSVMAIGYGGKSLGFATNYRVFFSDENPQLMAFEEFQAVYTKSDNIVFVIKPKEGDVFQPRVLKAVQELTEASWQIPYSIKVDSITNFQHTHSENDDLIVEDLIEDEPGALTPDELREKRAVALAEPLLIKRLIAPKAKTTAVVATLQFKELDPMEVPKAVAVARENLAKINEKYPELETALSGTVAMNNAFMESSMKDMGTLVPIMYLVLLISLLLFLRSFAGTIATLFIMAFATITAMGAGGWMGIMLTPPSATTPTIVLTLAIADSVHILVSMFKELRRGREKMQAIKEAVRINLQPVFLTSVTTAIGFLSLNFSDAPPFGHLGNMTAIGVMGAFVYSVCFLPAFISLFPLKASKQEEKEGGQYMLALSNWVIAKRTPLLYGMSAVVIFLAAMMPRIELNDEFVKYFDHRVDFRNDTEFMIENLSGIYQIEYSLAAKESGGISEPDYLQDLEKFANWLREKPEVDHVYAMTDVFKRLNKNMHNDDQDYYRIPDNRELSAQYLLLYEMSLPYGLDLNDRINVDKSATRLTVTLADLSTKDLRDFVAHIETWTKANLPDYMQTTATGPVVLFSYISERNIEGMTKGNILALLLISLLIGLALKSMRIGLISLLPNLAPVFMGFGIWAIFVGQINMAAAMVTAVSLGIIVDDTVHFLSKYYRARKEKGLKGEEAIRYAFTTVGPALVVTTITLLFGFGILAYSSFAVNSVLGILTSIVIVCALVADFLLLPPMLLKLEEMQKKEKKS